MECPSLLFGAATVFWPRVAEKSGKWFRGAVEAADCFTTRWHRDEAERSWLHHADEEAKSGDKGRGMAGREGHPHYRRTPPVDE